jgi:hypothetical protein
MQLIFKRDTVTAVPGMGVAVPVLPAILKASKKSADWNSRDTVRMELAGCCFGEKTKDLQPELCNSALTGGHKAFLNESNTRRRCAPLHRDPPLYMRTMFLGISTSDFNPPGKHLGNSETQ